MRARELIRNVLTRNHREEGPDIVAAPVRPAAPAGEVSRAFFERLDAHDLDGCLRLLRADAAVQLLPLRVRGAARSVGHDFLSALLEAFPDLRVSIHHSFTTGDGVAVVELKLEGTQAADFYGIVNQEKHIDLDQAWVVTVEDGLIAGVQAYWCQNQLYRRLGVKRLDQVTITGS